jgi:hypothetical protein
VFVFPNLLVGPVKGRNSFERLLRFIKGNLLWASSNRDQVTVLLYYLAEGYHNSDRAMQVRKLLKRAENQIYFYLVTGVSEEEFTIKGSIRSLAKFINQSVNGTVVTDFHLKEDWDIDSYLNDIASYLKEMINLNVVHH